jgi:hypothetical protein
MYALYLEDDFIMSNEDYMPVHFGLFLYAMMNPGKLALIMEAETGDKVIEVKKVGDTYEGYNYK